MKTTTKTKAKTSTKTTTSTEARTVKQLVEGYRKIRVELGKTIVGQSEVIEQILIALFAGGHCLITGAPGLAKTLLVKCISEILDLQFSRVQFTPDLMPADITGTEVLSETAKGRQLTFVPGPVFANMLLADEINRTPPKTQPRRVPQQPSARTNLPPTPLTCRYSCSSPFGP